jgi:hypothetical protein
MARLKRLSDCVSQHLPAYVGWIVNWNHPLDFLTGLIGSNFLDYLEGRPSGLPTFSTNRCERMKLGHAEKVDSTSVRSVILQNLLRKWHFLMSLMRMLHGGLEPPTSPL